MYIINISEKIKAVRKSNNLTQSDFARSLGTSRGNLANIETGKVMPTAMLITCISLMYNIDKSWLLNEEDEDLSALYIDNDMSSLLLSKYEQLNDDYRNLVRNHVEQLLEIQQKQEDQKSNQVPRIARKRSHDLLPAPNSELTEEELDILKEKIKNAEPVKDL